MPKFEWLNKQGVKSDTGFIVQCTGRFTIEYREGAKIVTVNVEPGFHAGRNVEIIGKDAFSKWDAPFTALEIPRQNQQAMFENFKAALEFQGLGVIVE